MSETSDPAPRPWRRRTLLALGALLLIYLTFRLCLTGYIKHELAEIRNAGEPVSLDELNDWYTTSDGKNAAPLYKEAFAPFLDPDSGGESLKYRQYISAPTDLRPIDEKILGGFRDFTTRNRPAINKAHAAAKVGRARFDFDYRELADINLDNSHQLGLTQLAQLLLVDCIVALEDGDTARALANVKTCAALSLALADEPSMSAFFSQQIIQKTAVDGLQRTLLRAPVGGEALAELQAGFEAAYANQDVRRAVRGERSQEFVRFMIPLGRRDALTNRERDMFPLLTLPGFGDMMDFECARYLRHTEKLIRYADEVYEGEGIRHDVGVFSSPIAHPAIPPPDFLKRNYGIHRARLASAITGIAVARYNHATGEPPNSLEELVPDYIAAIPEDPFRHGEPMNYIRFSKRGFVVYSVGENIVDDSGRDVKVMTHGRRTPGQARRSIAPGDIAFRMEHQQRNL